MKTQGIGYISKQKREKGIYYTATISLGYDSDGKQIRKTKSSYNLKEVKDWIKSVNTKSFTKASNITLVEYANQYLELHKKNNVSPTTYERYESRIRKYLKPQPIADMLVKDITQTQMQLYANTLVELGSIPIAHEIIAFLRTLFRRLSDEGEIEKNPCVDISLPKAKKKPRSFLSEHEQKIIFNNLNLDSKADLGIFLTMSLGCRLGELCGLKWEDIKDGVVNIEKQFGRVKGSEFAIKNTKTDSSVRQVPLPEVTVKILEKYRSTGYIFSDDGKIPFDRKRIQRRYKTICEENGIDSTFHCLRHTFATNMVELNVNPFVLQKLLGHKSISTTLIYSHITDQAKKDSVDKLNDKIKSSLFY
ncbi:MAG: tyrosine-type recombinase/integrase [Ezakiella coagulans]|uniref:tyrosine-type recombinase/integrase n=1 Tax=Ezakiella coagulans TaxID=46507 RepID=UPI00399B1A89